MWQRAGLTIDADFRGLSPDGLADLYATPAREAEVIGIFKEATRLEADFWEMGWRADKRLE
jgi:thiaminase (transcriptional activator TenA)